MKRRTLLLILSLTFWARLDTTYVVAAPRNAFEQDPFCGDGTCQYSTCDPQMPGSSGNGCEENQDSCSADCGYCGDNECQFGVEDSTSCYQDCPLDENYFPANSSNIYYPGDYAGPTYGVNWPALTWPQDWAAGDCFGNCGAGCSNFANPCGGDPQYWVMTIDEPPDYVEGSGNFCMDGDIFSGDFAGTIATITWTYHGWARDSCIDHDERCPEWTWLGCVIWVGCYGGGYTEEWSYTWRIAWDQTLTNVQYVGSGAGVCDGPEPPGPIIR